MEKKKRKLQIPIFLGVASVWFGTHAGPGSASGNMTASYYASFGKWGFITPIIAMGIMALAIYYALEYSRLKGITSFNEFTKSFFHPYEKIFLAFYEVTFLVTVLMVLGGSLATGAEIMKEYWNLPILIGTGLLILAAMVLSMYGQRLVRSSSTVMTIFIVFALTAIAVAGLASPDSDFMGQWQSTSFADHSFLDAAILAIVYAGFMSAGTMANTISVSEGLRSKKDSLKAAGIGMLMNIFLILIVVVLLFAYPQNLNDTLPNFTIINNTNISFLIFAYVIMVVLAVLSSIVSYAFTSLARYSSLLPIKEGMTRDIVTLLLLFVITFSISLLGLDVIVSQGYKYIGYAVIPTLIIPTIALGGRKIKEAEKEEQSS